MIRDSATTLSWACIGTLALLAACGSDSGDPDGGEAGSSDTDADVARCVETITTISVDEVSPAGFSARDALDAVGGPWQCDLTWNGAGPFATVSPDGGSTEAAVEIRHDGGDVRYVNNVREGGDPLERLGCLSFMEIDVDLEVTTADGALAESWSAVARVDGPSDNVMVEVEVVDFAGNYEYQLQEEWAQSGTMFTAAFSGGSAWGFLLEWSATENQLVDDPELGPVGEGNGTLATVAEYRCSAR